MATERAYWLAWSRIKGVGPVTLKHLWEHFGALAIAWQATAGELLAVDGIGLLSAEKITAQRAKLDPAKLLAQHEQENQSFWTPADADYPALLFAINDPPPLLYYRGNLRLNDHLNALSVGIVGTRRPSAYGQRWTQRLSRHLTRQGAVIVSGLAAGIDTMAHTSCLQQQGLTIAVLGTGVDVVYPTHNRELHQQIVATGLVVSEYADGTLPDKVHFPQRNRIIAGLSRAILVTEAPARSGALITVRLANDYCREVYALPCALDNLQGAGCLQAISDGAQMILGEQVLAEALAALPPIDVAVPDAAEIARSVTDQPNTIGKTGKTDKTSQMKKTRFSEESLASGLTASDLTDSGDDLASDPWVLRDLSPVLSQVLNALSVEPMVFDHIVQGAQMDTAAVLSALMQLELSGLVVQLPGMQYQRT